MSVWLYDILKPAAAPPTYSKNKPEGFCGFMSALYANIQMYHDQSKKKVDLTLKNLKWNNLLKWKEKSKYFSLFEQEIQVRLNRKNILCFSINRLVWSGSVDDIWISITQIF